MNAGKFITFEGIEGSGKTTQVKILEDYFEQHKVPYLSTREPGGTRISDQIRKLLLNPHHKELVPLAELFLYEAARAQHVAEIIVPALEEEKVVICDRFCDATTAYQGSARKIPMKFVEQCNHIASSDLRPRLTFLFDCPVEVGLRRARERYQQKYGADKGDRMEQEEMKFHERVREGYLAIAKKEPNRFTIIDGTMDIDSIQQKIIQEMERIL